jgi:hypothetical protein
VPKLLGRTQPRLWTPPLRPLSRRTSRGYEAADFAEIIGEPFLPWQRWLAIHAMELQPDGTYRFRVVIVLVARQNGKSTFKRTKSLHALYLDGARLVLGVAQDVSLAREQWNFAIETVEASAELAPELGVIRRVNGDEWFRIAEQQEITDSDEEDEWFRAAGGRYKIAASNRKAGRGLAVDELTIDELREQRNWRAWSALSKTTMARANAQIWCMSNQGDDDSVVLNQLREVALAGTDPSIGIFEWSGEDDCELDDWRQIRQANPGLGYTVSAAAIRTAISTDPVGVYRTEVLCQRVDQLDGAVNYAAWKSGADSAGTMDALRDRLACCFDAAPDGAHATLGVAAKLDSGRVRVEIVKAWDNTADPRTELPELLAKIKPRAFGWFPGGPAAGLATTLRALAVRYNKRPGERQPGDIPESGELSGGKVCEICQELADLVRARRIVHPADPLLDVHIKGASRLKSGDGWRFTRRGGGHVDAAYAAAGAISTALAIPEPRRAQIRVLGG